MKFCWQGLCCVLVAFCCSGWSLAAERLEYNRDIRPILFENCFACHGADSASRKGDLRLDQRDAAITAKAIVPGNLDESSVIERILTDDPELVMPPPATKKKLSERHKETLKRWIREGAEYQAHWSYIPPTRPALPAVKNSAWVRNPIDAFVLAKIEKAGWAPAAEADRRTLARRVCLDLTGLPPTPSQLNAFVNDTSPDAYEKYVDMLLASKGWGEHRARYWLDSARYADTHGLHFDNFREMWTYRQWVIEAFNRNLKFDQFTIENLAGDLLPNPTQDQLIASGFNRCNMTTNEGGIIDEEYLVLYARDRTETVSQVWMGMTANCGECHSHKFDPLSQTEFYRMSAFFNNSTQGARDGNILDTPPIIVVPQEPDAKRWEVLKGQVTTARKQVDARRSEARPTFDQWAKVTEPSALKNSLPSQGKYLAVAVDPSAGQQAQVALEGQNRSVPLTKTTTITPGPFPGTHALQLQGEAATLPEVGDFDGSQPFSISAWVKVPANDSHGSICARMDNEKGFQGWDLWIQQRRLGMHLINTWPGNALKVTAKRQLKPNQWVHVAVTYDGSRKAAGIQVYYDGKPEQTNVEADTLNASTRTAVPFKIGSRNTSDPIHATALHDLQIFKRVVTAGEVDTLARLAKYMGFLSKPVAQRQPAELNELYEWWLSAHDQPYQSHTQALAVLEREQAGIKSRGTIAHVTQEKSEPAMAYVLFRGEYDKRRDPVKPDTPAFLPPFPKDAPHNRLGFARWLLLSEHPLTARVTVNQFWQQVFGLGIVRTTGDFGVAGELPADQQLLDWLAVDFRESGWDIKRLFKLIVMSSTYRQAATVTPEKLAADPQNRLMSRGPRFRMDAEMVRDYSLAASGLLVSRLGGPSVKPYQPPGVWEAIAMDVSNTRSYSPDTGDKLYRRSLYTFWKRMAPPASLDLFNAPSREYCVVRRERTNTPMQALVTLNDEQFVEAARHLAQLVCRSGGSEFEQRIQIVSQRLIARDFRPDELPIVRNSFDKLSTYYAQHPDDAQKLIKVGASAPDPKIPAPELAAWTMLCNELMNLDEVLNK